MLALRGCDAAPAVDIPVALPRFKASSGGNVSAATTAITPTTGSINGSTANTAPDVVTTSVPQTGNVTLGADVTGGTTSLAGYTTDVPEMGSTASQNGSMTTPEAGNSTLMSNYTTVPSETTLQGNTSVTLPETGFRTTPEPHTGSTSESSFTQTSGENVTSSTTSNVLIDVSDYNTLSE